MANLKRQRVLSKAAATMTVTVAILAATLGYSMSALLSSRSSTGLETEHQDLPVQYIATTGTLDESVAAVVEARWTADVVVRSAAEGTITSMHADRATRLRPGDSPLSIDLHPLVLLPGDTPAFRGLEVRATGADVRQLQKYLASIDLYSKSNIDGEFGLSMRSSVRRWQEQIGVATSGSVEPGTIAFVETLPAFFVAPESLVVGARVGVGDPLLLELHDEPTLRLPILPHLVTRVTEGLSVRIDVEGVDVIGVIAEVAIDPESGDYFARLKLPESSCHSLCEPQGLGEPLSFTATIVLLEPIEGTLVPVSALVSAADVVSVRLADGTMQEVKVLASTDGMAVVEGLQEGVAVFLPSAE